MPWWRSTGSSDPVLTDTPEPVSTADAPAAPSRRRTWKRGPGLVAVIAVVPVASLVAGVLLSRVIVSPAQLASDAAAPVAGAITAPIESRVIENSITTRADVTYADAVDVRVDATGLSGPAVVTGHVPAVGDTLSAGSVALEVAGRPLIVLPGDLPVYRTLHAGLTGPDVLQLKAALASMALDPGDTASDEFDAATAAAIDRLYRAAGYEPPRSSDSVQDAVDAARDGVRNAQSALSQAQSALTTATRGPDDAARIEADNAVREAQRAIDSARARGADAFEIDRLNDELNLAVARRAQLLAPPAASAEQAGVSSAQDQLAEAEDRLARAENDALTVLPGSEVVYLSSLPRRVDAVGAERGKVADGAAMRVSGAELVLAGSASETDAALLKSGMTATFTAANDSEFAATVTSVSEKKAGGTDAAGASGGSKRYEVMLAPQDLSDAEVAALRGSNVRVAIPVESTDGDVLAVPVAALTAGAGGESRIELVVGRRDEGSDAAANAVGTAASGDPGTELVVVTTGLAAGGYVEVRADDPRVKAGAEVVVGR